MYIYISTYITLFKPMKYIHYSAADCPQPLVCWHFRLVFNSQGHTYHDLIICHYAPYNSKPVNLNLCTTPNNLPTNHSPIQSISIGANHYLEKQHIPRCRFLKYPSIWIVWTWHSPAYLCFTYLWMVQISPICGRFRNPKQPLGMCKTS